MADPVWGDPIRVTANNGLDDYPFPIIESDLYSTMLRRYDSNDGAGSPDMHFYSKEQASPTLPWGVSNGVRIDGLVPQVDGYDTASGFASRTGRRHAVWAQTGHTAARPDAKNIWYAYKDRTGGWSGAIDVTQYANGAYSAIRPSVATDRNGRIFVGLCAITGGGQYHQWTYYSSDSGATWNSIQWDIAVPGDYQPIYTHVTSNPEGDIWILIDEPFGRTGSARGQLHAWRMDQKSPALDPGVGGSWTDLGTWASATYMAAPPTEYSHFLTSPSHYEYLLTWNGETTAGTPKYHLLADWVLNGRGPGNPLAFSSGNGVIVDSRNSGGAVQPYRCRSGVGANKTGLAFDQYTMFGKLGGGTDFHMRVFWLQNNVWHEGVGPNTDATPHPPAGLVSRPVAVFPVGASRAYLAWYGDSV